VAWDELVKLRGVRTGRYAYYHPLFMIDLAQAAALVVPAPDLSSLAQLARVLGALAGGVMVFATFSLARLVLPALPSLAAAAATAATPLFIVHARLFKEDIFVSAFLVLALAALIRLLQEPAPHRAILVGLLVGLAAGSKYIGMLILPFAIIAILLVPTPGPERRWLRAGTVTATSIGTFLLIMLPAIRRIDRWERGVDFELRHSMLGHDVPLPIRVTWGLFHLRESLWPGLGTPLLALGLIGLAAPFVAARERRMPLLLIASFALLWYVAHEATPLKPFPDFPDTCCRSCRSSSSSARLSSTSSRRASIAEGSLRRSPSFSPPFRRYRCRGASTLQTSIRAPSFLPSSRQAARAQCSIAIPTTS